LHSHHHYVGLYRKIHSISPPKQLVFQEGLQLTLKLHSYPMRNGLDSLCPNLLIQLRVQPNITRAHRLLGKLNDRFDGPRCSLFEGSAVDMFMQMNGIFTSDDVLQSRTRLTTRLKNISLVNNERSIVAFVWRKFAQNIHLFRAFCSGGLWADGD
jgi:hypothetical protein